MCAWEDAFGQRWSACRVRVTLVSRMIGHRSGPSSARFFASTHPITREFSENDRRGPMQSHRPSKDAGMKGGGRGVMMLPSERGESGVCVKLRMWRERPKQGRGQKGSCGERASENGPPQRVPSAFASLTRCVRVCCDYEAASEIENVPTARTLRHTLKIIHKTVFPCSDFINVGKTEERRRILG